MSRIALPVLVAAAVVATAAPVQAAPADAAPRGSNVDRAFVVAASEDNAAEIAFARDALQRGNADTKAFARRMIRDHTTMQSRLTRAAGSAKLRLHRAPSLNQRRLIERTAKLDGVAFDAAYRAQQVLSHRAALLAFRLEVARGSSTALTGLARAAIPALRMHLMMARKLASTQKVTGAGG